MSRRYLAPVVAAAAIGILAAVPAGSQAQQAAGGSAAESTWTLPRTADGHPDLQGFWTTQTFTPLQRPEHLGDKEFFTEEEAAALQQELTAEGVDPLAGNVIALADAEEREQRLYQENRENNNPSYVHYDNEIWLRTPVPKGLSTRRTSLITDPPNGRFPPLTAEAEAPPSARRAASRALSTGTSAGRSPSGASSGRTTGRRCSRRPTTTSTRSCRRRTMSSSSPS